MAIESPRPLAHEANLHLNAEELDSLRRAKLSQSLQLYRERHPFYRQRIPSVDIDETNALEVLGGLPLTTKKEFVSSPEMFRLDTEGLSIEESTLWDVVYTAGTTSAKRAAFYSTSYDYYAILSLWRRLGTLLGMTPTDAVFSLFPLTGFPHGAFIRARDTATIIGAKFIAGMPGRVQSEQSLTRRSNQVLDLMEGTRPTVLWGVPTYVLRLLQRASKEGRDLASVRMVALTGEPAPRGMREQMKELLRALGADQPSTRVSYGITEFQSGMLECREYGPMHNLAPEYNLIQALDDEDLPVAAGEEGRLALIHLDRRGTVLLRYEVGDICRIETGPCPHCGISAERVVSTPRRTGDMVKVKGMLLNVPTVLEVLAGQPIADSQVAVTKEDPDNDYSEDVLEIRVVPMKESGMAAGDAADGGGGRAEAVLVEAISLEVKAATGITPRVVTGSANDLGFETQGLKFRRFIDERPSNL